MTLPPPARFRGRPKWSHAATFLAIATGAAIFVAIIVVAVPRDVLAMQAVAVYTAFMGGVCLVLAVTLVLARRLPAGRESTFEGGPAVLFRAWPLLWWLEVASDVGLAALGACLFVLGLLGTTETLVWGTVTLVVGLWFLARAGLAVAGRRHNESLWLTEDEVVHDAAWGRERCARADVTRIRQQADWQRLLVVVDGPITRELCPRPWRRTRARLFEEGDMSVDCDLMGPDVLDLVRWLQETVPAGGEAAIRRH